MSHITYNELWKEAMSTIGLLMDIENPKEPSLIPKQKSEIRQQYVLLYVHYIGVFRKLEDCFDQIVHPQKRVDVRKALEAVMGRILEIKEVLVKIDLSEFIRLDDVLLDLKVTPEACELSVPRYFVSDRAKELEEREKLLNALVTQYNMKKDSGRRKASTALLPLDEAVKIIQINERGRQGRKKARDIKEQRSKAIMEQSDRGSSSSNRNFVSPELASVQIQKTYRAHRARVEVNGRRQQEQVFIGMAPPEQQAGGGHDSSSGDPYEQLEHTRTRRKLIQNQNEQDYLQQLAVIKQKLHDYEGPDIKEHLQDEIRQWFMMHKEQTGKFPNYPTEEEGGSAKIFAPKPKASEQEAPADNGGKGGKGKNAKNAPGKSSGNAKKKPEDEAKKVPEVQLPPSNFLLAIHQSFETYTNVWANRDESSNFAQKFDAELVKEQLRPQVIEEIRKKVDEQMREELENLKLTLEGGKKKGKGKDKKKEKKKKVDNKKKKGDLTAHRSIESLYAELVSKDLVKKVPPMSLRDYIGDFNFVDATPNEPAAYRPSLADIRRVVTEYCVLPVGCAAVHNEIQSPAKVVLLHGAKGTGKTLLANAIANETGSVLFDLSPSNVRGKFPLIDMKLVLHMVFKVAAVMAPAVILIEDVDCVFGKDSSLEPYLAALPESLPAPEMVLPEPKAAPAEPGADGVVPEADDEPTPEPPVPASLSVNDLREEAGQFMTIFRKLLTAQVKALEPHDRVLIVGTSSNPNNGGKALISFCNKVIPLPLPNYSSRYLIWKTLIAKAINKSQPYDIDCGLLARLSDGFSAGSIKAAIDRALMAHRVQLISKYPLKVEEFINEIARLPKADDEELRKFQQKIVIKGFKKEDEEAPPPKSNKAKK